MKFDLESITTRRDSQPEISSRKLCLDAIADAWGYEHRKNPSEFKNEVAKELGLFNQPEKVIDRIYMDKVKNEEVLRFGDVLGLKKFELGKKALGCEE